MSKPFGFLSKHHIRRASEFDAVFKLGKRFSHACFSLHYLKTERDYPRLGQIVSKKNCPLAVHRNRIRRLVREKFRLNQHAFAGVDVVVMLRSSSAKTSDQELQACLEKLFSQLSALCDGSSPH